MNTEITKFSDRDRAVILIDGIPIANFLRTEIDGAYRYVVTGIVPMFASVWHNERQARHEIAAYLDEGVVPDK